MEFSPLCLIWLLWGEHNNHTFENVVVSESQIKRFFLRQTREWSDVLGLSDGNTVTEFIHFRLLVIVDLCF